jgi:tRNA threonylcarbamoyladenosine biosynthesis protein TsaE
LEGELGSGKTTFVKGVIEVLGYDKEEGISPTFVIAHEFLPRNQKENESNGFLPVLHIDLYRIDNLKELEELFISYVSEYSDSHVILVEWGEKVKPFLQKWGYEFVEVIIEICSETERIIKLIYT